MMPRLHRLFGAVLVYIEVINNIKTTQEMKKLLLWAAAPLLMGPLCAQNIALYSFKDEDKVLANGDTITVFLPSLDQPQENVLVKVKNIGPNAIRTNLRQRVINRIQGATYSFCYGNCYEDNFEAVLTGDAIVNILSGGFSEDLCIMDYNPNGKAGTTFVLYTFFNTDTPEDTASVVIRYDDGHVAVSDADAKAFRMSVSPNPASGNARISVQGYETLKHPVLRVSNLLGITVFEKQITPGAGSFQVDVSSWKSGVYFYSVWDGDRNIGTKKMIVSH